MPSKTRKPTSFHWGSYYAETENEKLIGIRPYENDKDPSKIANGIINSIDDELRIRVPHVRKGYLREIRKELANSKMALTGKRSRDKSKKILKIKHSLLALMVGVLLEDFIMPKVNFIDFLIAMADILGQ